MPRFEVHNMPVWNRVIAWPLVFLLENHPTSHLKPLCNTFAKCQVDWMNCCRGRLPFFSFKGWKNINFNQKQSLLKDVTKNNFAFCSRNSAFVDTAGPWGSKTLFKPNYASRKVTEWKHKSNLQTFSWVSWKGIVPFKQEAFRVLCTSCEISQVWTTIITHPLKSRFLLQLALHPGIWPVGM